MQPNIYKFFIDGTQVSPVYKALTKKYERETGQKLFREKLEGEIKLLGADYFLIKNSSIFTEHTFVIQRKNKEGLFEEYFTGLFSKTDCEFDLDKRICKLKLSPKDSYSSIIDNYSNEYNLVDLSPKLTTVTVSKRPVLQVYVLEDNIINNFLPSGATWETEVEPSGNLTALYEKGHFGLDSRQIEVVIKSGSKYDGVYTGSVWSAAILASPTNLNYVLMGSVNLVGDRYEYGFSLFNAGDITTPLYSVVDYSMSRFATITLLGASSSTSGKLLKADISMETVLTRVLSGLSTTRDGQKAEGQLTSEDFGYLPNYSYVFGALNMAHTTLRAATSENPTPYGKADNGFYYTDPSVLNTKYYPFAKSTWLSSSRWLHLNEAFSKTFDLSGSVNNGIKDCIHIADAIKALLKKIAPDITHEASPEYSQFLYGSANPVYGEKFELFITQKTHIKKFIYDTPATKVPITFEKLMNMLAKCFCCYWYIEDGKFKIEHSSYFDNGKSYDAASQGISIDTTATFDNKNGRAIEYGQSVIKYDKNALPSRYEFGYMDESSIEFEGAPIKLIAPYLQQDKIESITPEGFSADVDLIISNTTAISDDGFVLLAAKYENSSYSTFKYDLDLISDTYINYTVSLQNGVLSWIYLFNFYCTNLPTSIAEYDGAPKKEINVVGISRCMSHEIKVPVEADPSLYELVKTSIGAGQVNSLSVDITTRQATMELLYEPE